MKWYPNQVRIGAAPIVTIMMVFIAILGRTIWPGSPLFMWPLYAALPLVALLHILLVLDDSSMSRLDSMFYALVHIPLAFVVWTFSILFANGSNVF
ncbi:hypothetical protein HER31_00140 [Ferrimonas lipolytica]|uniref:Uncharacterized protein n=1 Tax=Ferrimonas lipolytica TaxID=2724191 RepID=A0A6H1UJH3_9GAMM|nr:hypothetical protein HER31_00140 [Ferrimonas lipolytica]